MGGGGDGGGSACLSFCDISMHLPNINTSDLIDSFMMIAFQATGVRLGVAIMNIANIGTGLIIAFIYGWQLTLLIIAFLPLLILGGYLEIRILAGVAGSNKAALEEAGKVGFVVHTSKEHVCI